MSGLYDQIDTNGDGVLTRSEFNSFGQGQLPPTGQTVTIDMQPLSSLRIQRADGGSMSPQVVLPTPSTYPASDLMPSLASSGGVPVRSWVASQSLPASIAQPISAVNLQPRVIPVEHQSVRASPVSAVSYTDTTFGGKEVFQAVPAKVLDVKQSRRVISSETQDLAMQGEVERDMHLRSMQDTHTLQIRMLEEMIEQKINRAMEAITVVSNQSEERFAHTEAYRLEMNSIMEDMRRDTDALHAHVMKISDMPDKEGNGDFMVALGSLQSDMDAMKNQHNATVSAIQALEDRNQHMGPVQETKAESQFLGGSMPERHQSELQRQLQSELSDLRHELTMLRAQQQEQSVQHQEMEAQVFQHLQGFKEQQQNEALLLRQDLEAALAANSHGDGMIELRRKYEDVSRDVDVALRELRTERHAKGASLDQLAALENERQEREREINNLASFMQEEREERMRIDEALDQRQQQISQETFQAVNEAFDEFRKEMRALAEQMIRQGPDKAEIESLVAKTIRPERDARSEFTRFMEAERAGRVQDLENEREARVRETTDLRSAVQRVMDRLAAIPELGSNEVGSRGVDQVLTDRVQALHESHSQAQTQLSSLRRDLEEVRTRSVATGQAGTISTSDLDAVLAGLEEETNKRCETCADLHARITRETADVRSQVDSVATQLRENIRAENSDWRTELEVRMDAKSRELLSDHGRTAGSAPGHLELTESLQHEVRAMLEKEHEELNLAIGDEHTARIRDVSTCRAEVVQIVEQERAARNTQVSELRSTLAKAITTERDERVAETSDQRAEIARLVRGLHRIARSIPGADAESPKTPSQEPTSPQETGNSESFGFLSRMFQKPRATE